MQKQTNCFKVLDRHLIAAWGGVFTIIKQGLMKEMLIITFYLLLVILVPEVLD